MKSLARVGCSVLVGFYQVCEIGFAGNVHVGAYTLLSLAFDLIVASYVVVQGTSGSIGFKLILDPFCLLDVLHWKVFEFIGVEGVVNERPSLVEYRRALLLWLA